MSTAPATLAPTPADIPAAGRRLPPTVSVTAYARATQLDPSTVRRHVYAGLIEAEQPGGPRGKWLILTHGLNAAMQALLALALAARS